MLHKPFDTPEPPASNPTARAGWQAEKELAFFLDRAFKADPAVHLFHSLRFKLPDHHAASEDDFAQIDHLILHRHGIIIVESKSLIGEVQINEHGEFTRIRARVREGIPSPVQQAVRQGEALRSLLQHHKSDLRDRKLLGLMQGGFKSCPIEVLVAISTHTIISGRGRSGLPEVHKADAIADAARAIIGKHREAGRLLSTDASAGNYDFTPAELVRVGEFLLRGNVPLALGRAPSSRPTAEPMNPRSQPEVVHAAPQPATPRKPPDVKPPVAGPRQPERAIAASSTPNPALEPLTCRHCRSINVIAVFKKDYCLECSECGKFTPLDYTCPACHTRAPIRKSGPEFRRECPCGHAAVFWRNT